MGPATNVPFLWLLPVFLPPPSHLTAVSEPAVQELKSKLSYCSLLTVSCVCARMCTHVRACMCPQGLLCLVSGPGCHDWDTWIFLSELGWALRVGIRVLGSNRGLVMPEGGVRMLLLEMPREGTGPFRPISLCRHRHRPGRTRVPLLQAVSVRPSSTKPSHAVKPLPPALLGVNEG